MSIFCFLDQIFFYEVNFCYLAFLRDSTSYSKRDDSGILETEVRNCWRYQGGVCCRQTVIGITVLHMINLFM